MGREGVLTSDSALAAAGEQPQVNPGPEVVGAPSAVVRWGRVGLAGLAFVGFGLGAALTALLIALTGWRYRRAGATARAAACQRWVQRAFTFLHDYMRVCGLLRFDPRQVDTTVPAPAFVMVANHPTLIDVASLAASYGRLACVAKGALFRAPVLGRIVRACAHLDGGEGDLFAGARVVQQALERLANDMPVLVFPEGTRSPPGGLHAFKRGAFEIAARAGVPVLPLLIRCEPLALDKGRPWYDIPRRTVVFTVTPLPVMHAADFGGDAAAMAAACEGVYRERLALPNRNTPTEK